MNTKLAPHTVVELTQREWDRYKKSAIHVTDTLIEKHEEYDHVLYQNVTCGENLKPMKRKSISNGKTGPSKSSKMPLDAFR